jgi:hypothetical protein
MFDTPEGMTPGEFRSHPLTQLLQHAANRNGSGLPSKANLDALGLPAHRRSQVEKAAKEVAELFDTGEQGNARALADEFAGLLLTIVGPEAAAPAEAPDPTEGMDPGQLADYVVSRRVN